MRMDANAPQAVAGCQTKKPEPVAPARPLTAPSGPVHVGKSARGITDEVSHKEAQQAEKVAALKSAVRAGSYKVDLDKLAAKIADDEIAKKSS